MSSITGKILQYLYYESDVVYLLLVAGVLFNNQGRATFIWHGNGHLRSCGEKFIYRSSTAFPGIIIVNQQYAVCIHARIEKLQSLHSRFK